MTASATRRSIAVFGAGFSFLVMLVSGAMLIVAPKGRTANQIDWSLFGLDRGGWEAVHLATSFLFAAIAIWHIVLHWPIILNFLHGTPAHPNGHRLEGLAMLVLVVALLVTAILDLPPSSWLIELNEYFKQVYWNPS